MPEQLPETSQEFIRKYKEMLAEKLELPKLEKPEMTVVTREYRQFREELMPAHLSIYEQACNISEKILHVRVKPEREAKLRESIRIAHLNITPSGAVSLSIALPIAVMLFGVLFGMALAGSLFLTMFFIAAGLALMALLGNYPDYLANSWRMKASNQMVLAVFYIVTYMRHTSNLENAIAFASEHLAPPLSLDLKKVLWDVETGLYESVKESLDAYLETWKKWNAEFVDALHLVESSLYETTEERRLGLLDKSLDVILEETYEKMLHYAQNLKSPITMLHMLGIILPILGLVILPLVVSFMGNVKWWHLAILYNVTLPLAVYYLGKNILAKRPTGYGDTDIAEINPELKKYRNILINIAGFELKISPAYLAVLVGIALLFFATMPVVLHILDPEFDIPLPGGFELLGYRQSTNNPDIIVGPYGLGASVLSLLVPLALALGFGTYYKLTSQKVLKIREETKKLEDEFSTALFQLGNRLGDGLPAEIAFSKVADSMQGTVSGNFFQIVATNIVKLGMGIKEAIFNPHAGALVYFPSNVIQSSMKVLIESVKKGPLVAAQALMNVSRYIKEIHRVNERLKDLMADVISDMKSQIGFLTPAIAGIVIGITSMITTILGTLTGNIKSITASETAGAGAGITQLATMFGDGIPTYYFQIVVGIYVFQIIFLLTILVNGIENGADKLGERYLLGTNLIKSTFLYCTISLIVMVLFNAIAAKVVGVATGIG